MPPHRRMTHPTMDELCLTYQWETIIHGNDVNESRHTCRDSFMGSFVYATRLMLAWRTRAWREWWSSIDMWDMGLPFICVETHPSICETWETIIHPRTSTPCELESCCTYKWAHEWVSTRMNGSPWMSYDTYQQAMVLINKSWYVGVSPASSHDTSIVCCSVLQCVAVCCSVYGSTRYIQRWMNGTRSNVACQVATIHVT